MIGDRPPHRWLALVRALVPARRRDEAEGDLVELWHLRRAQGGRGIRRAFWRDAASLIRESRHVRAREPNRFTRGRRVADWWRGLVSDVRRGARILTVDRGLAALVTITLAAGVGASAAVVSAADSILFRALPVPDPDAVVALYGIDRRTGVFDETSFPDYETMRDTAHSFEALAAYVRLPLDLDLGATRVAVRADAVTTNFFTMLRLRPRLGRAFGPRDEAADARAFVMMISERLWRDRFGADPATVGREVTVHGQAFQIIGIVPAAFTGQNFGWGGRPDVWIPIRSSPAVLPALARADVLHRRDAPFVLMMGRLQPRASLGAAQAEAAGLAATLARSNADPGADRSIDVVPAGRAKFWPAYRDAVRQSAAALAGATMLLLLLVCANLASLLFTRVLRRRRDLAVRAAVGASRGRLVQQLLVESAWLALPGFVLSILVAAAIQRALMSVPAIFGTGLDAVAPFDVRLIGIAAGLSAAAAGVFAIAPALRARRVDVSAALAADSRGATAARGDRARQALLVVQIALSAVAVAGAVLVVRGIVSTRGIDLGYNLSKLVLVSVEAAAPDAPPAEMHTAVARAVDRLRTLPGIESATTTSDLPLTGIRMVRTAAATPDRASAVTTDTYAVGTGFFETMGTRVIAGRSFTDDEARRAPAIIVVNHTFAERAWPGADAVGRSVYVWSGAARTRVRVVGVAADMMYRNPWSPAAPTIYLPSGAVPSRAQIVTRVRAGVPPASVAPIVQRAVDTPGLVVTGVDAGPERLDAALGPERAAGLFLGALAAIALVIASVGLYGSAAFVVAERSREISIRLAIGGAPGRVAAAIVRPLAVCTAIGIAAAVPAAAALLPFLANQAKGVAPDDWPTIAIAAAFTAAACAVAMLLPARQAARVDPVEALRSS
jgi:predicted permease